MEWCVRDYKEANHPPVVKVAGAMRRAVKAGEEVELDASGSSDPDGNALKIEWVVYPEAGGYRGEIPAIADESGGRAKLTIPGVAAGQAIHLIAVVTDDGKPALTRYGRVIFEAKQ
jgi:hypothetical protein